MKKAIIRQILSPPGQAFLEAYATADPAALLLQRQRFAGLPLSELVVQLQARRKATRKLPTWAASPQVIFDNLLSVEQATAEAVARYKATLLPPGRRGRFADLTGGLGVDTFFLSEGFQESFCLEQNPDLAETTAHNLGVLGRPQVQVLAHEALQWLEQCPDGHFDVLYLDPARRDAAARKVVQLADCEPDFLENKALLFRKSPYVLLKTSPLLDIQLALNQTGGATGVYVLAHGEEVKELLFSFAPAALSPDPPLSVVLLGNTPQSFTFTRKQEAAAPVSYAAPQRYLYEPHAAVLKAGAFRSVAAAFGLHKLAPSSHLYTAETAIKGFPGRSFEIVAVEKPDRRAVARHLPEGRGHLSVRNFPTGAEALRKQLHLRDGGDFYLFATTSFNNKHLLLITRKQNS